jgi:hypothetical protein
LCRRSIPETKALKDELDSSSPELFSSIQVFQVLSRWLVNLIISIEQPDGEEHENFKFVMRRFWPPSCGEEGEIGGSESRKLALILENTVSRSVSGKKRN